ncbi:MAG: hypothetical protein ACREA0_01720 [bacterium]
MDDLEIWFDKGVTDGLPVIPPTRDRVAAAVAATGRAAGEVIARVPPNFGRATVERIAINAVMAGCRPEYLPVVIAGVDAMCDEGFDLHGVSATTNFPSPLFIVNGPARKQLDINCGAGLFGPGWRANATIGRALRLVAVNLGGAIPGVVSMSTMAHPGRYTYCIGEAEEESPWDSLAVEHGFGPGESVIAAFAGEAPHGVYDHLSRTAPDLLITIARSLEVISHHKSTHHGDTLVVLSPEHARTIADDGWGKTEMREFLWTRLRKPVRELIPGMDGGEGLPAHVLAKFAHPEADDTLIAKFREPGNLKFVVAGGTAGRFSAVIPGWTFPKSSRMIWRKIHAPEEAS